VLATELGSLTLEFTRLSQLTENSKYFDAAQRVMDVFEKEQSKTKIPGLWPHMLNAKTSSFTDGSFFSIGGMVDSLYEYLPKVGLISRPICWGVTDVEQQHILLSGATNQYRKLFSNAATAIKEHLLFRPAILHDEDVLVPGDFNYNGQLSLSKQKRDPRVQHLSCFSGGMFALSAKVFQIQEHLATARKLVEGCLWGYEVAATGIMPEIMRTMVCPYLDQPCDLDEQEWYQIVNATNPGIEAPEEKVLIHHLPPGVTSIPDRRYLLRYYASSSVPCSVAC